MLRPALALAALVLAVAAVPAGARIVVVDRSGAVVATPVRDDRVDLLGFTDDGSGLLVRRGKQASRVGVADAQVTALPKLDRALSIGPGGRSVIDDGGPNGPALSLRSPEGAVLARPTLDLVPWEELPVAWSPDGRRVALADHRDVLVLDTATGATVLKLALARVRLAGQAFAPGGSALVVVAGPDVLRVDLPSGTRTVLFHAAVQDDLRSAAWGATGRIAVTVGDHARVLDAAPVDVAAGGLDLPPSWTPDGEALTTSVPGPSQPCGAVPAGVALTVPGAAPTMLLLPTTAPLEHAAWSPDGGLLAVDLGEDFVAELDRRGHRRPWPRRIPHDFGMFSRRGDAAVRAVVITASRALRRGVRREETMRLVRVAFARVARRFDEAGDSAVQETLADALDPWLRAAGFASIDALDELDC